MQTENKGNFRPQKKSTRWILKSILAILVVLVLLVLIVVPAFVSSENGRKTILAKINSSVEGKTDFSGLSMGWVRGIKITDFSFRDKAGRILVAVKQIATKPHYLAILTGNLSFGETVIDRPTVQINLETPQPQKTAAPHQQASAGEESRTIAVPVKKIDLVVRDGDVKIIGEKAQTVELSQINSKVNLQPAGQQTNFDVNMTVVGQTGQSNISVDGRINPAAAKTGWTLKGTTGEITVEVNDLDIGSLAPILALAGADVQAKGRISVSINGKIQDGRFENLAGTVNGKDLDITAGQLKGDRLKISRLDAGIKLHRENDLLNIEKLQVNSDWLNAEAGGVVPTTFGSLAEFTKPDSKYSLRGSFKLDLAALLSQMPKTIGLKPDTKITAGRLSGSIETTGQADQRKISGEINLAGLAGAVAGKPVALSEPLTAATIITSGKSGLKFDKLDVSSAFCKINCTGSTESFKYQADVNLAKLQAEAGQFIDTGTYKFAGSFLGSGSVSTDKDKIIAAGTSSVKNLLIIAKDGVNAVEPNASIDFSVAVERQKNILNIDSVKLGAAFGRVNIKNAVLPLGEKTDKPMTLTVSMESIDLEKLRPFMILFASFPKEMLLAGVADSQVSVSSEKDVYKITTDSTRIKNLKVVYPGQTPFEQPEISVAFDVETNPVQKQLAVRKLELTSPQIKIHKGEFIQSQDGGQTKLQGRLDYEYDWAALGAIAGPFLPAGLQLTGKRNDTITFSSQWPYGKTDQMLGNMTGSAALGWQSAEYMGLQVGQTEIKAQIEKGKLTISPFTTTINNGTLNFGANADFRQKPAMLTIPKPMSILKDVQINDRVAAALLKNVNPIFASAKNTQGAANLDCNELAIPLSGGTETDTKIDATVSVMNLHLQSPVLEMLALLLQKNINSGMTLHPTQFVMRQGVLTYDKMQLDLGDMAMLFGGQMGPGDNIKMSVTVPGLGGIAFKGTKDKPQLDPVKIAELTLQQQLLGGKQKGTGAQLGQQPQQQQQPSQEQQLIKGLEGLLKKGKK